MKKVIMFLTILLGGIIVAHAEENEYITTVTNPGYTIDVVAETGTSASNLVMTLKGYTAAEGVSYYVAFSNTNTLSASITEAAIGCSLESSYNDPTKFHTVNNNGKILLGADWYILDGYTNAYVVKMSTDSNFKKNCEVISEPIVLTKPELPVLGQRYNIHIFTEYKSMDVLPLFPFRGEMGDHKITTKVGLISDNNIVKKFANGASDAYTSLLTFAKSNEGRSFNFVDSEGLTMDISGMSIQNGKYYYIYNTYTDTIYRNLEDVAIAMGVNGTLTNNVVYDIPETEEPATQTPTTQAPTTEAPKEETTTTKKAEQDNPKTGLSNNTIILIGLMAISGTALILVKKRKYFIGE